MSKFYDTELLVQFVKGQLKTQVIDKRKLKFFYLEVELQCGHSTIRDYNPLYATTIFGTSQGGEPKSFNSIDFGKQNIFPLTLRMDTQFFNNVRISKFNARYKDNIVTITLGLEIPSQKTAPLLSLFGEETKIVVTKKQLEMFDDNQLGINLE